MTTERRYPIGIQTTAKEALKQIDSKRYALPCRSEDKRVVKVGVSFDAETRTPQDWVIAK
jgi:hypothetical protein